MAVTYRQNLRGIAAIANTAKVGAYCAARAKVGMQAAITEARRFRKSGRYEQAFKVDRARVTYVSHRYAPSVRAGARLVNTADYAAWLELKAPEGADSVGRHILAHAIPVIEGGDR